MVVLSFLQLLLLFFVFFIRSLTAVRRLHQIFPLIVAKALKAIHMKVSFEAHFYSVIKVVRDPLVGVRASDADDDVT